MVFDDLFRDPPISYRLAPFWFWNGSMESTEIVEQIREMAEKGVGGFFICARQGLDIPYLSEQWFQRVALAIETAEHYGLHAWLYDEYPYPSGMSGGEVTLRHPDAKQRQLLHRSIRVSGPRTLSDTLPWASVLFARATPMGQEMDGPHATDLAPYIGSSPAQLVFQSTGLTSYNNKRFFTADLQKQLVWDVPEGDWQISIFLEQEIADFKYFGNYVDPCHEEAMRTFIATTHDAYARRFEAQFGQTIKGLFTDEVGLLGRIPWSTQLPQYVRDHYGYELLDHLLTLLAPNGEQTARVRYTYFQSIHQLLLETYHKRVGSWCDEHSLQYLTEVPSMRMTTQLYSHIPGGDSAHEKVGRSLEWILDSNLYSLRANPKVTSSLARQLGRERAAIECFHSVGWSMTLQDARWMLDNMAALGINFFVFHAFFASIDSLRKHDAPPSQFLQNPYWQHFRQLADYAGRLSYSLSQGTADISIAVVHPTTTFWTHMGNPLHNFRYCGDDPAEERALERLKQDWAYLCKQLLLHQVDYDHLDPELLANATIEERCLCTGQARYEVLILPPMTNLEVAAWSRIRAFLHAGGKVIALGLLPYEDIDQQGRIEDEMLVYFGLQESPRQHYWQSLDDPQEEKEDPGQPWTKGSHDAYFIAGGPQQTGTFERLLTLLRQCVPPGIFLEPMVGDSTSLLMQQRNLPDGSRLVFITHQEGTQKRLRIHLAQRSGRPVVERLDLVSGTVTRLPIEKTGHDWWFLLSFAPYESYLLRCSFRAEEQASEEIAVEPQPWTLALDVRQPWKLSAWQDNNVRLGTFRFALDQHHTGLQKRWHEGEIDEAWPIVESKPIVNQCADIAATQTFPLQFKQTFGIPARSSLAYPLNCWYHSAFFVAETPPACQLVMDEGAIGGEYTVYLNGQRISAANFKPAAPHGYRQQSREVVSFLKPGINHLVIQLEAGRDEDGVRDPLYLCGPFGVTFDDQGMAIIGKAPATGSPRSDVQPGYPYYAGTLCFSREITIGVLPNEPTFEVMLQGWDKYIHDCVEVVVNGHSLGVCCWSPYRWRGASTLLRQGSNSVEIRVTNTLSGLLEGAYFDERSHQMRPVQG